MPDKYGSDPDRRMKIKARGGCEYFATAALKRWWSAYTADEVVVMPCALFS